MKPSQTIIAVVLVIAVVSLCYLSQPKTIDTSAEEQEESLGTESSTQTTENTETEEETPIEVMVSSPIIYPDEDTYDDWLKAEITCNTSGATIYYNTNGRQPDNSSYKYTEPIEIRTDTTIIATAILNGVASKQTVKTYRVDYGGVALDEIGGMQYIWWSFDEDYFKELNVDFTINIDPDNNDGLYLQFYQSHINDVGFYFGLQTDVYMPGEGGTGKGFIFSRWETNDVANLRTAEDGWYEAAGYEGDFISVRKSYEWTTGKYSVILKNEESDDVGDWYGFWVFDHQTNTIEYIGSLRFPKTDESHSGISKTGGTWTELYHKDTLGTPIPRWNVTINGIYATEAKKPPREASIYFSEIEHTDILYQNNEFTFITGKEITRTNYQRVYHVK